MTDLKHVLRRVLHKELLLDLEDRLRAEAVKAHEMVRDRSGLDQKRARELEGQARFRMMEQGFQAVCELHGGHFIEGGVLPVTELKIYQPFMRFDDETNGIVLGLASLPEPQVIPVKNKSRLAGVSLNYNLSPRLDFDGTGPKIGDIFALFLVSRDRERAGKLEEIAIGVVDSKYETYLLYERLDSFLSDSQSATDPGPVAPTPTVDISAPATVSLKKVVTPFIPPEAPAAEHRDETGTVADGPPQK